MCKFHSVVNSSLLTEWMPHKNDHLKQPFSEKADVQSRFLSVNLLTICSADIAISGCIASTQMQCI